MTIAALTTYTTYDDIRAALGVSTDDLEDATLALAFYADYLQTEMEAVDVSVPATYVSVKALASPSDIQARFLMYSRLFATFSVAKQLTVSLPLFAASQETDGKASAQRFDDAYKATAASIIQQYDRTRARLVLALAAIGTTLVAPPTLVFFAQPSGSVDPVTGV